MTKSLWKNWSVDARMSSKDLLCYVPVEVDMITCNVTFVIGMNFLASPDEPPGKVVCIMHPDGDKAAQKWVDENGPVLERVKAAMKKKFPEEPTRQTAQPSSKENPDQNEKPFLDVINP
jgi:hypothetical protein